MEPIIVGIDPGTTSAFAAISFELKVLMVKSKKNYSLSGIIQDVFETGNPIIVATDKKEVPKFVKEFAQKTGTKIFTPSYDTKKGEKKHLVEDLDLGKHVKNVHEIDALASAIMGFNHYGLTLQKINRFVTKNHKEKMRNELISKVILKNYSIKKAISELEKPIVMKPVQKTRIKPTKNVSKEQKEIEIQKELILELNQKINKLNDEINTIKSKKVDISKEIKKIISNKETRAIELEKQNKSLLEQVLRLKESIDKLNKFISMTKNAILIKKVDNLNDEKIEKEDIILVEDISILSQRGFENIKDKIKIIIYCKGKNKLLSGFILIPKNKLNLTESERYALANPVQFNSEIKRSLKSDPKYLTGIIEDYKRQRLQEII